ELRVLECYDLPADSGRFRLPHFSTLPIQRLELMGDGPPIGSGAAVRRLVAERLGRELARDAVPAFADARARASTPRAWARAWPGDERAELSLGLEGGWDGVSQGGAKSSRWRDGTGVHVRASAQVDRWLAFFHLTLGELHGARSFTDVLVS